VKEVPRTDGRGKDSSRDGGENKHGEDPKIKHPVMPLEKGMLGKRKGKRGTLLKLSGNAQGANNSRGKKVESERKLKLDEVGRKSLKP